MESQTAIESVRNSVMSGGIPIVKYY